jgi:hypothetical protein
MQQSATPIIVYQMGKVGSKTVAASLASMDVKAPIFHEHFLSDVSIDRLRANVERGENVRRSAEILTTINERREVIDADNGKRWKVVTLVREPISRGIGTFMASYFKGWQAFQLTDADSAQRIAEMQAQYHQRGHKYSDYEAHWFKTEIESMFSIDVLSDEFDAEKGYQTYSGDKADVLLIRLEDIGRSGRDAFREFLGVDGFSVVNANTSEGKDYRPIYDQFLRTLEFDPTFLDETYDKPVVSHCYSPQEIDAFKLKWGG